MHLSYKATLALFALALAATAGCAAGATKRDGVDSTAAAPSAFEVDSPRARTATSTYR